MIKSDAAIVTEIPLCFVFARREYEGTGRVSEIAI